MPTVFLPDANLAISLPLTRGAGYVLDAEEAEILNRIWLKRLVTRLRWLLSRGEIDAQTVEAKARELASMPMSPYSSADIEDEDDPILTEAMEMAKTLISSRMAAEGLPLPKGLETHARALVDSVPALLERARLRVEARYQAAAQALGDLA